MKEVDAVIGFDAADGKGVVIMRSCEGKVCLCVSLESNGEVEAELDSRQAVELIRFLQAAHDSIKENAPSGDL